MFQAYDSAMEVKQIDDIIIPMHDIDMKYVLVVPIWVISKYLAKERIGKK
jgi:hypothetical protein